ncbi:putative membrane protein [Asticcacaulis biprosthecium C19]|uniref:Putative membrane protein n=1 Tax=Asticcacaulis biprosthecium C19 TaxID=715226 RepID=F4QMU8_9CAUL|nr:putative membrane protein [Asticcacaulis biprosthecium C19]
MKVLKQWVLAFVMATAPLGAPLAALANPAPPRIRQPMPT